MRHPIEEVGDKRVCPETGTPFRKGEKAMTTYDALNAMLATQGRIFAVDFLCRRMVQGQRVPRKMVCRIGVGGPNTLFHHGGRNLVLVWDIQARGHRWIPVEGLRHLKTDGGDWIEVTQPRYDNI